MALKKDQEREYARILFISENITNKALAERLGVQEKTIAKWIREGGWEKLRRSMITTRQNQLVLLYDQLEWQNLEISKREAKVATASEADVIVKLTSSIRRLETETSLGETVEVARLFIEFVRQSDLELAKKVTKYFDLYIQNKAR